MMRHRSGRPAQVFEASGGEHGSGLCRTPVGDGSRDRFGVESLPDPGHGHRQCPGQSRRGGPRVDDIDEDVLGFGSGDRGIASAGEFRRHRHDDDGFGSVLAQPAIGLGELGRGCHRSGDLGAVGHLRAQMSGIDLTVGEGDSADEHGQRHHGEEASGGLTQLFAFVGGELCRGVRDQPDSHGRPRAR